MNRALLASLLAMALSGCGSSGPAPPTDPGLVTTLERVRSAIASSTGYAPDSIEVLASPAHLRISISDRKLAEADQAAREGVATTILAAAEQSMAADARLSSIQQVSVAIIHPAGLGANAASHTEDVVDFRRAPSQRFSKHIS